MTTNTEYQIEKYSLYHGSDWLEKTPLWEVASPARVHCIWRSEVHRRCKELPGHAGHSSTQEFPYVCCAGMNGTRNVLLIPRAWMWRVRLMMCASFEL